MILDLCGTGVFSNHRDLSSIGSWSFGGGVE